MSERKREGRWGRVYFLIPWEFRGYVFQRNARPLIFGLIILWIRLQAHHCFLSNSCELTWNDRHTPTRSGYRQRVPPLTTVFFTNFKIIIKKKRHSSTRHHATTTAFLHFFLPFLWEVWERGECVGEADDESGTVAVRWVCGRVPAVACGGRYGGM